MPATSPTLSPTLSAMTAGLRGSSSGMPASTLPTRSAPTSAAFVKMPPPTRANSAIEEAPSENPKSSLGSGIPPSPRQSVRPTTPARPRPTTLIPMTVPEENATFKASPIDVCAASVVRTLAVVAVRMPRKPAMTEHRAPTRKQSAVPPRTGPSASGIEKLSVPSSSVLSLSLSRHHWNFSQPPASTKTVSALPRMITKKKRIVYSVRRNAIAPLRMAPDRRTISSLPAGHLLSRRESTIAAIMAITASTPAPMTWVRGSSIARASSVTLGPLWMPEKWERGERNGCVRSVKPPR